jgi:hypothetical protein
MDKLDPKSKLKAAPAIQGDPDIIRSGNDVTIMAPTAEVTIDLTLNSEEN